MSTIVWFRNDLRLADQPALVAACARGNPVIPVYILSEDEEGDWRLGGASRWWLHHSLERLADQLRHSGSRLVLRRGSARDELQKLIRETGATAVYWGRRYEPAARHRDQSIKSHLREQGLTAESLNVALLWEPWTIKTGAGECYKVFTPFWRKCLETGGVDRPLDPPTQIPAPGNWPASLPLDALKLKPKIPWDGGLEAAWNPGSDGAGQLLARFLESAWSDYSTARDHPGVSGTSRLSPHLHFGEISPRLIWHELRDHARNSPHGPARAEPYLRQLVWREFAHHLLFHFPQTPLAPLRDEFAKFPWRDDPAMLRTWQRGQTGYPWIDAGMRELWHTGWMHNRVRMATASFLVKHLLIPWQRGAEWFWDTLVDADLANNTLGWQWTAGCGADAAPYFRIFNPFSQGTKFDPAGDYVRRWIPELARLPDRWIYEPFNAPADVLRDARVTLGTTYPLPVVDHATGRQRALDALASLKR